MIKSERQRAFIQKVLKLEYNQWHGKAKECALAILVCFAVRITTGDSIEVLMKKKIKPVSGDYQI